MAVILDTGFIGVHVVCGEVAEVPIRQASWLPTVLDLERTQGCEEVEGTCADFSQGNEGSRRVSEKLGAHLREMGWNSVLAPPIRPEMRPKQLPRWAVDSKTSGTLGDEGLFPSQLKSHV